MARFGYPLMLDITRRRCVIVGGGKVALRKARGLLYGTAGSIVVVAPEIHPDMPSSVDRILEPYEPRHLQGAGLVFAVTSSASVNAQVVADAQAQGILTNRADSGASGDFTVPASYRDGGLTVSVSTPGHPALASRVRDALAGSVDPRWVRLSELLDEVRPMIRARVDDPRRRRRMLKLLTTDHAMALAELRNPETILEWALSRTE